MAVENALSKGDLKVAARNRAGAYREAGLADTETPVRPGEQSRVRVQVPAGRVPVPVGIDAVAAGDHWGTTSSIRLPLRQRHPRHLGAIHRSSSHPPPRSSAALLDPIGALGAGMSSRFVGCLHRVSGGHHGSRAERLLRASKPSCECRALGSAFSAARWRTLIRRHTEQLRSDVCNHLANVEARRDALIVTVELERRRAMHERPKPQRNRLGVGGVSVLAAIGRHLVNYVLQTLFAGLRRPA